MRLDKFQDSKFQRGASKLKEALWLATSGIIVESWLPGSRWRSFLLRLFGANVGKGVVIKPRVRVKFPWRLNIGAHSWIGENVWIDNLTHVDIGCHSCISQGSYLCTGSHDWSSETFELVVRPIVIADHAWVCAFALVAPGTTIEEGAVLGMGELGSGRLTKWTMQKSTGQQQRSIETCSSPSDFEGNRKI